MKKIAKLFLPLVMMAIMPLAGCQKDVEEKIEITKVPNFYVGEEPDMSEITVKYTDTKGATTDLKYGAPDLTFSSINTQTAGKQMLHATYKETLKAQLEIEVQDIEIGRNAWVTSFSAPTNIYLYWNNITKKGVDGDKGHNGDFVDGTDGYHIGTATPVTLKPQVKLYYEGSDYPIDYTSYEPQIELFTKTGEAIVGANLEAALQVVNAKTHSYQFKIPNQEYKVKFSAKDADLDPYAEVGSSSYELEVKTIEAFNAHNLGEFTLMDNMEGKWDVYRATNGVNLPGAWEANGVVLHGNIDIPKEALPSSILHPQPARNGYELLNWHNVFEHRSDEDYTLVGNYFQIDASDVPQVYRSSSDGSGTPIPVEGQAAFWVDAAIFRFAPTIVDRSKTTAENITRQTATFKNTKFVGNGGYENDLGKATSAYSIHFDTSNATIEDCIIESSLIAAKFNSIYTLKDNTVRIINNKIFNLYEYGFYFDHAAQAYLEGNLIWHVGGPAVILRARGKDVTYLDDAGVQYLSNIYFDTLDFIDVEAMGSEAWYQLVMATGLAGQIAALDSGFKALNEAMLFPQGIEGRSIMYQKSDDPNKNWFNLVGIIQPYFTVGADKLTGFFYEGTEAKKDQALVVTDGSMMDTHPKVGPYYNALPPRMMAAFQSFTSKVGPSDPMYLGMLSETEGNLYSGGNAIGAADAQMVLKFMAGTYISCFTRHDSAADMGLAILAKFHPVKP